MESTHTAPCSADRASVAAQMVYIGSIWCVPNSSLCQAILPACKAEALQGMLLQ